MEFMHFDLGQMSGGEIVEISLSGSAANVRLLDSTNFSSYRAGHPYRCIGGLARRSPVRLEVPHVSHWHVIVDMAGLSGTTKAVARVIARPRSSG
ncbi:MAG: DUF1883 domain-containing protein [Chloroflexi bacterium]|nr:DUF1883 domain-containing protein [Chloroflexota bacterium]